MNAKLTPHADANRTVLRGSRTHARLNFDRIRRSWTWAVCLLAPLTVGCTASQGVIRSQTPAPEFAQQPFAHPASHAQFGGPMVPPGGPMFDPHCPVGPAGAAWGHPGAAWGHPGAVCMRCMGTGCAYCGSSGCFGYGFRPYHHHTIKHKGHLGHTYPAPNQPPAFVQYPYYTHKGPSDFFLQ